MANANTGSPALRNRLGEVEANGSQVSQLGFISDLKRSLREQRPLPSHPKKLIVGKLFLIDMIS